MRRFHLFFYLGPLTLFLSLNAWPQEEVRVKTYDQVKASMEEVLSLKFDQFAILKTAWQVSSPLLPNQGSIKEVSEESIAGLTGLALSSCLVRYDLDSKLVPGLRWFYGPVDNMNATAIFNLNEAKMVVEEMFMIILGRVGTQAEIDLLFNWDLRTDGNTNLSQREKYGSACALLLANANFMIKQYF